MVYFIPFEGHIAADEVGEKQTPALHEINDLTKGGTAGIEGNLVVFDGNKILFFARHGIVHTEP